MPIHSKSSSPTQKHPLSTQILQDIKDELFENSSSKSLTFATFPDQVTFETQEIKEEIILLLRRHAITNVGWLFLVFVMLILPFGAFAFPPFEILPPNFKIMTIVLWYLFTAAVVFENFLSWYFNVYIITDERLVDVDFFSLIYKRISETKIDKIQDVSYSQGGFMQSFFNYGKILIQTAAEQQEFEFEAVPQPARVTKIINQLIMQEEQEKIEGRVR
jgi:membrane protein YdbS with pleckstrin-like domain